MLPRKRTESIAALSHMGNLLNIHQLQLFYYVAVHRGITAALPHIPWGVQQPAISAQLAQLEEDLGSPLFIRRPFTLTPTGETLFQSIAPFFASLPHIPERVVGARRQRLRLMAGASVLRDHLPLLLREMQRLVPDLAVTIREGTQQHAEKALAAHECDLALVLRNAEALSPFHWETLISMEMLLLTPSNCSGTGLEIIRRESARSPLIALPPDRTLTREFAVALGARNLEWPVRIETSSVELIEAYVSAGLGYGLTVQIPGRKITPDLRAIPLRSFPKIAFGTLTMAEPEPVVAQFIELCRMRVEQMVAVSNAAQGSDATR